jgi:hypothetical protein
MINLEIEAAIVAHGIDKPFDFALKRRIIAAYIDARARLLRNSITSNKQIPSDCIQSFAVPIVKAESFSLYYLDNYKLSVRTVDRVPVPIRLNQDTSFISITSIDGSINFAESDFATVRFNSSAGKFVSKTGRYIYHAEHIACYHNEPALLTSPFIMIRGVMENPLEVKDYLNQYVYNEENFPMPMDMAYDIRQMILKGDIVIPPSEQTIPINGK